jgi:hypothetical protein
MKLYIKILFTSTCCILLAVVGAIYSSCNRDKCRTIICMNRGICNNGSCTCPEGYEGINCETENRKKFTGNWRVFEKGSNSLAKQYGISIVNGEKATDLLITNFNNYFKTPIHGYVDGLRLIIPVQRLQGKVVYGEGTIYSNVTYGQYGGITMRYMVQDSLTLIKDDYGYQPELDFSEPSNWNK